MSSVGLNNVKAGLTSGSSGRGLSSAKSAPLSRAVMQRQ